MPLKNSHMCGAGFYYVSDDGKYIAIDVMDLKQDSTEIIETDLNTMRKRYDASILINKNGCDMLIVYKVRNSFVRRLLKFHGAGTEDIFPKKHRRNASIARRRRRYHGREKTDI